MSSFQGVQIDHDALDALDATAVSPGSGENQSQVDGGPARIRER